MHKLAVTLCLCTAFAASRPAHANFFQYTFSGVDDYSLFYFTAQSPILVTTTTTLPTETCSDTFLGYPHDVPNPPCTSATLTFSPDPPYGANFLSLFGPVGEASTGVDPHFFDLGTHVDGPFAMTITEEPSAVTPEPASIALLSTGVLGLLAAVRQRRSSGAAPFMHGAA